MAQIKIGELLSGYHTPEDGSGKRFISFGLTGSFTLGMRWHTAGKVAKLGDRLSRLVSYSSTRSYGMFLMSFGFLTMLVYVVKAYLGYYAELPLAELIFGAVLSAVSVPLLVFDHPLCLALQDFPPTDYIFFEFFCIKRMHYTRAERGIHPAIALAVGILMAALEVVVPVFWVVLAIGILVYLYLTFISPEFSFLLILLSIPYLPLLPYYAYILAGAVGVTIVSFARKVVQGKRVYFVEQYDIVGCVALILIAVLGFLGRGWGSVPGSLTVILLAGGYVLSSCLITNRRLADCTVNAIVISSVPASILALTDFIIGIAKGGVSAISPSSAGFNSPDELALFLLMTIGFLIYSVKETRGGGRTLYALLLVINIGALVSTMSGFALVAAILGTIAYIVTRVRRVSGFILAFIALLPSAVLFISPDFIERAERIPGLSFLGLGDAVARFPESLSQFVYNIFLGTGQMGDGGASENLFIGIGARAGVFVLGLFVLILFIRICHRIIYCSYVRHSQVSSLSRITAAVTVSMLAFGAVNCFAAEPAALYIFLSVFGVGSATLRLSKREFDDRVDYFSQERSKDTSSVNIVIR